MLNVYHRDCLELGDARPFDKDGGFHSSPLATSLLLPMGTVATPSSPSAPSEMLRHSHSSSGERFAPFLVLDRDSGKAKDICHS